MLDSSILLLVNYFPFTIINFIYTNTGIFFHQCWFPFYQYWHIIFFYPCWIPLHQYWYIIYVLPMLGYITLYQHWYVIYLFQVSHPRGLREFRTTFIFVGQILCQWWAIQWTHHIIQCLTKVIFNQTEEIWSQQTFSHWMSWKYPGAQI